MDRLQNVSTPSIKKFYKEIKEKQQEEKEQIKEVGLGLETGDVVQQGCQKIILEGSTGFEVNSYVLLCDAP